MRYSFDFETTTDINDCRVWAWAGCPISDEISEFTFGNKIDTFIQWCNNHCGDILYFHNLKFDGEFILSWLLKHNYKHTVKQNLKVNEFSTLISDKGQFYSIKIRFNNNKENNSITIYDSLKILPFSVDEISKAFNLPISKLSLDYSSYRKPNHELTQSEKDYIKNDIYIVAQALNILFKQGLNKMTQGSNALDNYRKPLKKNFRRWFPKLDYKIDKDIRQAYRGGFTYLKNSEPTEIEEGIVLDMNSIYPNVMRNMLLPYGEPIFFEGEYKKDKEYPLYIQKVSVNFKIKPNHLPTLQLKNNLSFIPTEYIMTSNNEEIEMYLTNVDLDLFKKHYDIIEIDYLSGWKFRASKDMFTNYIDYWTNIKIEADITGNKPMRTLAKLMLNALYGKFGLNPDVQSKIPYLSEQGIVKYHLGEKETRDGIYIPVAVYVTSYARMLTITAAQNNYDRFIYADTDSLHLVGLDIPSNIEIHPTKLGAWKHESTFLRAKYIRSKTYFEDEVNNTFYLPELKLYGSTKPKITCCGMPKTSYQYVTYDNFEIGLNVKGKLKPQHVKNGILLVEEEFTIKERKRRNDKT